MRAVVPILITTLTLILILLIFTQNSSGDWTIMVYLNGDNDLKAYANDDLEEMKNTNTGDDLLILHDDNTTNQDDTVLYHYKNGKKTDKNPAWLDDEENMGAQSTLEDFVSWCMDEYYSTNTMLIFWDHGGAWKGVCWDDESNEDNLRIKEIRDALNNSLGGEKLDILYFGACSLSTVEVSYELRNFTDYIVGSEKTAWVYWDVGFILNFRLLFEHMEGNYDDEDICEYIVDESMVMNANREKHSHTWSAMEMDEMPDLTTALDAFSTQLMTHFPEYYMDIIHARENTEEYKAGKRVSIYHFAENILYDNSFPEQLRDAANDLMDEINVTVIANASWTGTQAPSRGTEGKQADEDGEGEIQWDTGEKDKEGEEEIQWDTGDKDKEGEGEILWDTGDKDKEESRADHSHGMHIYFPINRTVRSSDYRDETYGVWLFTEETLWENWFYLYGSYIFVDDDNSGYEDGSLQYPFNTIQEAIEEAGNGSIIRVFEGTYYESIRIDKPLTIIGNGTNTVIDGPSRNAVTIISDDVELSKLFIYTPTGEDDIEIQAEDVLIANCTLSNCGGSSIHILHGDDITIEWSVIRMAVDAGVTISDSDDVKFDNCEIYDNSGHGVKIYLSTDIEFSFCRIHDNGDDGIYVSGSTDTRIWDSDIYDNADHGVYTALATTDTDARFCYWGHESGPGKEGPGSGDDITKEVPYSPWLGLPAGTQPNQIYHVNPTGLIQDAVNHAEDWDLILAHEGTYFENVWVNKPLILSGIMDTPPYPTIDGRNLGDAVLITADWASVMRFNLTSAFGGDDGLQIGVNGGNVSHVTVSECYFNGSTDNGIELFHTAEGNTIRNCIITEAGENGILFVDSNDLAAKDNTIYNCEIYKCNENGIKIEEDCEDNTITNCNVFNNSDVGIWDDGKYTMITFCDIHGNGNHGVVFRDSDHSAVNDCNIRDNGLYGVYEYTSASYCDAMFNYWEHWSGPGGSGPGNGEKVSSKVDYSPWLKYPVGTHPQIIIVDDTGLIQDAVDHAEDWDTVRVYAGNFSEDVVVGKKIDLIGNGSAGETGNNTVIYAGAVGDAVQVLSDWVNISGFFLHTGTTGDNALEIRGDQVSVGNCRLNGSGSDSVYVRYSDYCSLDNLSIQNAGGYGIRLYGFIFKQTYDSRFNSITNCSIYDSVAGGILIGNHCSDNQITDCEVFRSQGMGIEIRDDRNLVYNCMISENLDIGVYVNDSSLNEISECLIFGNFDSGIYLGYADRTRIVDCEIENNQEGGIILIDADNATISDCIVISNSGGNGIYLATADSYTITDCDVSESEENGIKSSFSDSGVITGCEVKNNQENGFHISGSSDIRITGCNIVSNDDYGVYNPTIALHVNARFNYWGHMSGPGGVGPGIGDEVSENVFYSPWYGNKAGAIPQTICVDASPGSRIQMAIDLAKKGDRVKVFSGTYSEHLSINKMIHLVGNGSKNTIIDGLGIGDVIFVRPVAHGVNISGFTIKGSGEGETNAGIKVKSNGNNLFDLVCIDNYNGISIEGGEHNTLRNVKSMNNKCGILLASASHTRIINNTCTNNEKEGIGIIKSHHSNLTGNIILGNGLGILVKDNSKDNFAHDNRIVDNRDFGVRIVNNGDNGFDATRNFWGRDSGPFHTKLNPKYKDGPGGNITELVEFSPWLDERGNLIYTQDDPEPEEDDGDDEWFIPGFEAMIFVFVCLWMSIFMRRRKKRS